MHRHMRTTSYSDCCTWLSSYISASDTVACALGPLVAAVAVSLATVSDDSASVYSATAASDTTCKHKCISSAMHSSRNR
jgi:hypothetical protein